MVGTTSLESGLNAVLESGRPDGWGRVRGFLGTLDAAGRREGALLLQARMCRRPDPVVADALEHLAGQELGWSTAEADVLLARLLGKGAAVAPHELWEGKGWRSLLPIALSAAEQAEECDRPRLRALRRTAENLSVSASDEFAGLRDRIDALLRREVPVVEGRLPRDLLDALDEYGPAMRAAHGELLAGRGAAGFLTHCALVDRARATRTWRRRASALLAETEAGAELVRRLLEGIAAQPEHEVTDLGSWAAASGPGIAGESNTCLVRGLLWASLDLDVDWAVPLAGAVAVHAGTGLGGSGGECRSQPLASAAVAVLGEVEGPRGEQAVQWLGHVRGAVRNRTVLKAVAKALEAVAGRAGLTPSMLRERGTPVHGLDGRGMREEALGEYTAVLSVQEPGVASLSFRGPQGRVLKSAPKAVRERYGARLASLRAASKELRALLALERSRLEDHLAAGTTWPVEDWERYSIDHPVTGVVARALVWEAAPEDGERWIAGLPERTGGGWALAGADGTATPVGPGARLRLWHPVLAAGEEVSEWRTELTERELRQPFKQVFREVYPLSPAEVATGAHTSRFAGRVLRYGRARALMAERGWTGDHLGYFGDGASSEVVRELPRPGDLPVAQGVFWRARFLVELVDAGSPAGGVAALCSTGRVRFERRSASAGARGPWERAALTDVPAPLLSEALRDVDLFVEVASLGPDDGDEESWSFGEPTEPTRSALPERMKPTRPERAEPTESARIRRETLARLLPRTRIGDRVELTDHFLRVRGRLRAYRIHLGSGSVLMEPTDEVLPLVVDREASDGGRGEKVFLPFEEDGGLLSVILSKAFLLASDAGITDRTITDLIRKGL
ncbi:DUF4132 domain-containing protein [Streptomyces sp. NPDC002992]|uniref:DUF4132 domain-containing protein n=1 Tax=Streptomyces sp. NPDC002992 TaxID=3154273 RepID=UPI0033B4674B